MSLCGCGDGGNPKLTMMDACNYIRAQESVQWYGRESLERNVARLGDKSEHGWSYRALKSHRFIEISMVTHHSPDSGRKWDRGRRVSRCGESIDIGSRMCTRIDCWVRMDVRPIRCILFGALCSVISRFGASYENLIRRQQRRWCWEPRRLSLKYRCSHRVLGKSLRFDHKMRCDEIFYD